MGQQSDRFEVHLVWPRAGPYRPLGETGPAATVEAPASVIVHVLAPMHRKRFEGPAEVELHLELEEGQYVIAELHVWARPGAAGERRSRPYLQGQSLPGAESGGIDFEAVRSFNYRRVLRQGLAGVVRPVSDQGDGLLSTQRKPPGVDPNWDVALAYVIAKAVGDNPTQAVAHDLGISQPAAAQRVRRARQLGYLPKTTRGRT